MPKRSVIARIPLLTQSPYVIVADDDESMRELLCKVLRGLSLRVVGAKNGLALMEQLRTCGTFLPALIVTDLQMPELTGMAAIEQMRQARIDVPVILITAFGSANIHKDAFRRGVVAVLDKPFSLAALRKLASLVLEGKLPGSHERLLRRP